MRAERRGEIVRPHILPEEWSRDDKLNSVSFSSQALFLRIVEAALMSDRNGRVTLKRVTECGAGLKNLKRYLSELVSVGMLRWDSSGAEYFVVDTKKWIRVQGYAIDGRLAPSPDHTLRPALNQPSTGPELALNSEDGFPGKSTDDVDPRGRAALRSPAPPRAVIASRSPSGPDREPITGRTAQPRSGGRAEEIAAMRAPWDPPDGVRLAAPNAQADIEKSIKEAQANSEHSTGKNVSFTKYPPDRPTEPITSALFGKAEPK